MANFYKLFKQQISTIMINTKKLNSIIPNPLTADDKCYLALNPPAIILLFSVSPAIIG